MPMASQSRPEGAGPATILMGVALLLLLWAVWLVHEVVMAVLLACVLAAALNPPVRWLEKRQWPKRISILVFYLAFLLLIGGIGFLTASALIEQGRDLIENLPEYRQTAERALRNLPFATQQDRWLSMLSDNLQNLGERAISMLVSTVDYLFSFVRGIVSVLIVLVLAYFLLVDAEYFRQAILRLVPPAARERTENLLVLLAQKTGAYVLGRLIVMAILGISVWAVLGLMGVPYAFLLGVATFLLEIIPFLGPTLAAVLGLLVVLGHDPGLFIWVLLFYIVLQQLENYILTPRILGESVEMHPVWVFLSILIGGVLFGVPGVILAVPAAVAIGLLLEEFYIGDYLCQERFQGKEPPRIPSAD
jgi:predicted PurR-regulated permease PerM